jgi:hypothetical protein
VCGAVGLALVTLAGRNVGIALAVLSLGTAGIISALPNFWSLPTAFLGGTAAAAGIAIINSFGNLAGFVAPYLIGWVRERTHSTDVGMYVLAIMLVAGAGLVIALPPRLVNK